MYNDKITKEKAYSVLDIDFYRCHYIRLLENKKTKMSFDEFDYFKLILTTFDHSYSLRNNTTTKECEVELVTSETIKKSEIEEHERVISLVKNITEWTNRENISINELTPPILQRKFHTGYYTASKALQLLKNDLD